METTILNRAFYLQVALRRFINEEILARSTRGYPEAQQEGLVLLDSKHMTETPDRFVKALGHKISGCTEDPAQFLATQFDENGYDEMIHIRSIRIVTLCAHHFENIIGKAHFAYVPNGKIVGLSKIPRMIHCLCHRPQVQENLTEEIVDVFQKKVEPLGCAVNIRAYHMCMIARGVEEPTSFTETTALRGSFKENPATRQEFLASIDRTEVVFP
jgi:GTP cyclohydrolase IA